MNILEWMKIFETARSEGVFHWNAANSARDWTCCSVGCRLQIENPNLIEREGAEKINGNAERYFTKRAVQLGIRFYNEICSDKVKDAKKTFLEIQSLPNILKREYKVGGV